MDIKYCTCIKCCNETKLNIIIILLSYSAKYSYKCNNCEYKGYIICEECYSKSE